VSTPGIFRFPVRTAEAFGLLDEGERDREDIAADLDYQDTAVENFLSDVTASGSVATFGQSMDRGRDGATFATSTTYSTNVTYEATFSLVPRVVLSVECGRGQDIRPILTAVTSSGFSYKLTNAATSTTTCFVHWVAVSQG
jgi:hypothetical protein